MLKTISRVAIGLVIAASIGSAFATNRGQKPTTGFQAPDGDWLQGVADGVNWNYQYNITAAGTNQATATQLPANKPLVELDTVSSGTGATLPTALQGTTIYLYNNGASNAVIYPAVANNPATSAQDTINNTTSVTVNAHTAEMFFCVKTGVWAAK